METVVNGDFAMFGATRSGASLIHEANLFNLATQMAPESCRALRRQAPSGLSLATENSPIRNDPTETISVHRIRGLRRSIFLQGRARRGASASGCLFQQFLGLRRISGSNFPLKIHQA